MVRESRLVGIDPAGGFSGRFPLRAGTAGDGAGRDGRRLFPDHPTARCGQRSYRARHGQRPSALYNAFVNKTPLIVTAGNQRRFMQNQYCLLTNIDPTTVPKPFVKWAAEP